jgi:hypothetical protein
MQNQVRLTVAVAAAQFKKLNFHAFFLEVIFSLVCLLSFTLLINNIKIL